MNIQELNAFIQKEKEEHQLSLKELSDGHHTFEELYRQRMVLFCTLCNTYPELSWKSKKHFDEIHDPMFPGDFIVGINTPEGVATYHFKMTYWDLFQVPVMEHAPYYDHYTSEMVLERVSSLVKQKNKTT